MKVEIELPEPPEGFEYTGEYRQAVAGEYLLNCEGEAHLFEGDRTGLSYHILRKKKPVRWRAEYDGHYWYVDNFCTPDCNEEYDDSIDDHLCEIGNYFRTQEEAEAAAKKVRQVFQDIMEGEL